MNLIREYFSYVQQKIKDPKIQKHSKNVSWMFIARIGSMAITFIATAYIARHLGPTNYGQLSYSISFVSLFSFIASLGTDAILHRELVKFPHRKNEFLGSALFIRSISSFVAILITIFVALFLSSKDVSLILIFIISLSPLLGTFQLLSYEFQAKHQSKYPSILTLLNVFILNILKIVVIIFDKGVIYLALVVILEPVIYSLGYLYLKSKIYHDINKLTWSKEASFIILRDSFPLIFASAFYLIYSRIDQVMLKYMIDSKAVGLYDAAVRISEVTYFIPQTFLLSFFPSLVNARETSWELYLKRTKSLLILLFTISVVIAILMTVFSKYLILIIFGGSFIGALSALYISVWSTVGASLNAFAQQILVVENLTKNTTIATFLGMLFNIVLNLILIPRYGISGAALATLISYMIPFLSLFAFKKTRILLTNMLQKEIL